MSFVLRKALLTRRLSLYVLALLSLFTFSSAYAAIERASVSESGAEFDGNSDYSSVSADGRYIAFDSNATNLIDGNPLLAPEWHVYVKDLLTGAVERVSVNNAGVRGDADSQSPTISGDGCVVVFESIATNLGSVTPSVFAHNRCTTPGVTEKLNVDTDGADLDGSASYVDINDDGSVVVFKLYNGGVVSDIYVRDRVENTTLMVGSRDELSYRPWPEAG